MSKDIGAHIGDDPFANPHDQEIANGTGSCQGTHHADQHGEIGIDQRGVIGAEAEVDHPADRRRKNKRYDGGREQGCNCRCNHGLVPEEIRHQPGKRAKRSAGLSGWGLGFVGRGVGHWGLLVVPSRLSMFRSADNDFGQSRQEL